MKLGLFKSISRKFVEKRFGKPTDKVPPGVKNEIEKFELMDHGEQMGKPMLDYLLPNGTQPVKMSQYEAEYIEKSKTNQLCANCDSMYQHSFSGFYICSKIQWKIRPEGGCALWNPGDKDRYQ